jgi:hypothetical protein
VFSDKSRVSPSLLPRTVAIAFISLAVFLAGCHHAPVAAADPVVAADTFFTSLEKGDPHDAYNSAAFGFQVAQSYEGFLSNARDLDMIGGQPPVWSRKDLGASEARLDGTLISQHGNSVFVTITLTPDGGVWKLFSLKTIAAPGETKPENRFTLIGKGPEFNDVYHQPMPNPKQIDALVHQTMDQFNTAIRTGTFHQFYNGIAEQWKAGQFLSGAAASGVTENMLKDHFQGFIDKKVDLAEVDTVPPVYDKPPQINAEGMLETLGHFDTSQYRVEFSLEYAYEMPNWKLFGINVDLRVPTSGKP